eukprot:3874470-Alexandrium_andersonii.AAC.1
MVPLEATPPHRAVLAQELERERPRIANHPSAGPSDGVAHARWTRPGRARSIPEMYDMAVGDSEHLRNVGGAIQLGGPTP